MRRRKLGNSGLEVSALGLGCMGLTFGYAKLKAPPQRSKFTEIAIPRISRHGSDGKLRPIL